MNRKETGLFPIINYTLFTILGILTLYPLWYVIMYSFSDPDLPSLNGLYLWPTKFSLVTYKYVISRATIYRGILISIFITSVGTFISLLATALAAYPLSKENLYGRKSIFVYFIFTMLFSGGMVPTYLVVRKLGLIDSLWALILPAVSVYHMLIMIKFFKGIPISLFESARIDGANEIYIFFRIVIPLSKAMFAALGLFTAVGYWNSYIPAALYLTSVEKYPLQMVIYGMLTTNINAATVMGVKKTTVTPMSLKMAAVVISLVPILMVYPFIQKYFMTGVMLGSVKG